MKGRRLHPASMATDLKRFLFVLLLPVLQHILAPPDQGPFWRSLLSGEFFAAFAILLYAFYHWWSSSFEADASGFALTQGVFLRRRVALDWSAVASADLLYPFWLAPLGGAVLRIDTPAKGRRKADLSLILPRDAARRLLFLLRGGEVVDSKTPDYKAGWLPLLAMAASSSNAAAGLLFAVPLINNAGKLMGKELADRIYGTVSRASQVLAVALPPLFGGAAVLLGAGWLIGFLRILFRHARLTVRRGRKAISVSAGTVQHRQNVLRIGRIQALDLQQSLLLRAFKLHASYLLCAGYGKENGERSVLIPAARENEMAAAVSRVLPEFALEAGDAGIRPPRESRFLYMIPPLLLLLAVWALTVTALFLLPAFESVALLTGAGASLPCVWQLILQLISHRESGIRPGPGAWVVCCKKGFVIHTLVIPSDRIGRLDIIQSAGQRKRNLCTVRLAVAGEAKCSFTVYHLPARAAIALQKMR